MPIKSLARSLVARFERRYESMAKDPRYKAHSIGRATYGRPKVLWEGAARLSIGSFCSIADGVTIMLGGNHRTDWVTTFPFPSMAGFAECKHIQGHPASKGDVFIGSDVWIGQDALILSGVSIGHGAVIGSRSVVAKDIPPYAIAVGNPARVVRMRFSGSTISRLLAVGWWNWPDDYIREHLPLLLSPDISAFLRAAELHMSGVDLSKVQEIRDA